jgi:hypothetical protein
MLIVSLRLSRFSYFYPEFKNWCCGDRNRATLVQVIHRWPLVASTIEVPSTGGAPQGTTGIEVAEVSPQLGASVKNLLQTPLPGRLLWHRTTLPSVLRMQRIELPWWRGRH